MSSLVLLISLTELVWHRVLTLQVLAFLVSVLRNHPIIDEGHEIPALSWFVARVAGYALLGTLRSASARRPLHAERSEMT